nr:MAG TPA: glycosyltransferase [Caudoviricetes sp.]
MKIEVFIPAFNCDETIERTLHSLAAQTDKDFRVCVVNDCSKPESRILYHCERFIDVLNIRYVENSENVGCGLSRQRAIDTSVADYLIPLDSDDCLLPMAISVFRQAAERHPTADFFSAWAYNEIPDPRGSGTGFLTLKDGLTLVSGKMYRRQFLIDKQIRNCEEFSRFADDTYFNMLSFELGEVHHIDFPVYFYTLNPNSVTNANGGKDYWSNVVPKFLRCIEATTEKIVQFKRGDRIMHLQNTIPYIHEVVENRGNPDEMADYNHCINRITELGVPDTFERFKMKGE